MYFAPDRRMCSWNVQTRERTQHHMDKCSRIQHMANEKRQREKEAKLQKSIKLYIEMKVLYRYSDQIIYVLYREAKILYTEYYI